MDVAQFLPATLELIIMAGVFMVIGTFILGLLAGKYKNTWVDGLIRVLSYIGVALPAFVIGILLLLLFGYKLQAIPVLGRLSTTLVAPKTVTGFLCWMRCWQVISQWPGMHFYTCFFRHLHLPYRRWFRMPESFALLWLITQPKNIWQFLRDMDFLEPVDPEVSSETVSNLGNYDHGYGFCVFDGKCIPGRAYFQLAWYFQIWN